MTRDKVSMKVGLQDTSKREVSCLKVLSGAGGKREEGGKKEREEERQCRKGERWGRREK